MFDLQSRVRPTPLQALYLVVALVFSHIVFNATVVIEGRRYFSLGDDAMISMRYAYNWAHGQGLVWNPGERVQGYSNPGWTVIMGVVHLLRLPLRFNAFAMLGINLLLHLLLIRLVFIHVRKRRAWGVAMLAAVLVAFDLPLLVWSTSGFETSLQTLFVSMALLPLLPIDPQRDPDAKALLALPPLTGMAAVVRPDAVLLFAVGTLAVCGLVYPHTKAPTDQNAAADRKGVADRMRWIRGLGMSVGAGIVLVVGLFVAQKAYYGDWLPNTFRLKASGGARSAVASPQYWKKFLWDDAQLPVALCAAAYLMRGLIARASRSRFVGVSVTLAAWCGYVIWTGGDAFAHSRFFAPVLPVLIAATAALTGELCRPLASVDFPPPAGDYALTVRVPSGSSRVRLIALLGSGFGVMALAGVIAAEDEAAVTKSVNRENILVAERLNRLPVPSDATVGVFWAGTTAYFMAETRFHDMLGKSEKHIASLPATRGLVGHNKWDLDYSLGVVAPELLITSSPVASDEDARRLLKEEREYVYHPAMMLHAMFKKCYSRLHVEAGRDAPPGRWVYRRVKSTFGACLPDDRPP